MVKGTRFTDIRDAGNSAAVARAGLIHELARVFGSQCEVLAVDAKRSGAAAQFASSLDLFTEDFTGAITLN